MHKGFIYKIEYIGNNPIIKGLNYIGSKTFTKNWEKYLGSPSKKNCDKVKEWRCLTKLFPDDFKRTILKIVSCDENIVEQEINYMKKVSDDIVNDPLWLNCAIPRLGGFPSYKPSQRDYEEMNKKRKATNKERYGVDCLLRSTEFKKKHTMKKYGVESFSQLPTSRSNISECMKRYWSTRTEEQLHLHGKKSLENRNPENVAKGVESAKRKRVEWTEDHKSFIENKRRANWEKSYYNMSEDKKRERSIRCSEASKKQKQTFITYRDLDSNITHSKFLTDMIKLEGYKRDGIDSRIKNKDIFSKPIKKRKGGNPSNIQLIRVEYKSRCIV